MRPFNRFTLKLSAIHAGLFGAFTKKSQYEWTGQLTSGKVPDSTTSLLGKRAQALLFQWAYEERYAKGLRGIRKRGESRLLKVINPSKTPCQKRSAHTPPKSLTEPCPSGHVLSLELRSQS